MTQPTPAWNDDNHALQTGRLLGLFMEVGITAYPVMNGSDYTPWIDIVLPSIDLLPRRTLRVHVEGVVEEVF